MFSLRTSRTAPTEGTQPVYSTPGGGVHPHALRHSLASALAMEGKPLPTITAQLGHSSTAVTDRYLAKIAPADLVIQIRDRGRL